MSRRPRRGDGRHYHPSDHGDHLVRLLPDELEMMAGDSADSASPPNDSTNVDVPVRERRGRRRSLSVGSLGGSKHRSPSRSRSRAPSLPDRTSRLERSRSDLGALGRDASSDDESVKSARSVQSARSARSSSSHTSTMSMRRRLSDPDFQLAARAQQLKQQQSFVDDGTVRHVLELDSVGPSLPRNSSTGSLRSVRSLPMDLPSPPRTPTLTERSPRVSVTADRHSHMSLLHVRNWIARGAIDDSTLGSNVYDPPPSPFPSDTFAAGVGLGGAVGDSVALQSLAVPERKDSVAVTIAPVQEEGAQAEEKGASSMRARLRALGSDFVDVLPKLPKFVTKMKLKPALTIAELPKRTVNYDSEEAEEHVIPFIMGLGQALQRCCVPAHRLEYELDLLSQAFGIQGHFFSVPGVLLSSFGSPTTVLSPYTHLISTGGATWDIEKIRRLENLGEKVAFGHLSCAEGLMRIEEIMAEPPLYGDFVTAVSFAACSCGIAQLFGGSVNDILTSTVVGLLVGFLCVLCNYLTRLAPMSDILSGALSAICGGLCAHLFNTSDFIVTICGIISIVPGLSITVAVAEIAWNKLVPGVAHLAAALLCVLKLAAGIMLGQTFMNHVWKGTLTYSGHPISDFYYFLTLPLTAWSFMVMLRSRMNEFWSVMIACILGYVGGSVLAEPLGSNMSAFVGAFMVCAFANATTWFWREGVASVAIFTGTLLLVPGSMGVKGVLELGGSLNSDQNYFLQMFLVALFICQGLFAANFVIRPHKAL